MSKLSYLVKRAVKMDWKRMMETALMLHKKTNKPTLWLLKDMLNCALKYNAGYIDYKIAAMYNLSDAQRKTVITRGISNRIVRNMNDKAYWHHFDDKTQFNTLFAEQVKRDWMKMDAQTPQEKLEQFLARHDVILYKPLEGSSGQGIVKFTKADWAHMTVFRQKLIDMGEGILEELVIQHPRMAALCPTSVNTIRIATLLGDKQEGIVYAFIRIGNGKVMDNVDCGGMAARVDIDTGVLKTVAADKQGNVFDTHPMTNTPIVGFEIPCWEEAKEMCLTAMKKVPQMRFVAWDVAITANGPVFIEGNSFPSHAIPQFAAHYPDGIGILPEFEKFITLNSLKA